MEDLLAEPPGSIAVFARRTGVPAAQLRRWHARGWLVPDEVDALSGYRRYAAHQLGPGRLLGALIATGMPARSAARALADSDRGAVLAHLEAVAHGVSVIREHLPVARGLSVHEEITPSVRAAVLACRT